MTKLINPTVILDCRWLGIGGPGRTTELVLRGLAENPPADRWRLWGDRTVISSVSWPDADMVHISADPRRWTGQRHAYDIPDGDVVIFMHQMRPVRNVPSVTVIYDTIPLRHGNNRVLREAKRIFLRRIATSTRQILTISEHSKSSIVRDLGVAEDGVKVLRFPFDSAFVERVQQLRQTEPRQNTALYVGNFLPHKNLPRLLRAFDLTTFRSDGGRLVLTGGTGKQIVAIEHALTPAQRTFVEVRRVCGQADLDRLFANSLFLVQPSLEEGFGLPAWEALCCGLPVCASDGGALPEVVGGFTEPFVATSTAAMATAIDQCAARARAWTPEVALRESQRVRESAPTIREFGDRFRSIVEHHGLAIRTP